MRWSWRIGTLAGIKVYMHWTFLILLAWVFFLHFSPSGDLFLALQGVAFILALFGCVVLHELGHALMARRFHIPTRDITLLPIGGVARLERMPREPRQELLVAVAGPAVNVVIAALLFAGLQLFSGVVPWSEVSIVGGSFLAQLMWVNLFLVAFNMLPAFPMDGGRVLRALLARKLDYAHATTIAARIGQGLAIVFALAGLFLAGNPMLLLIGLFVFLGAQAESQMVQVTTSLRGLRVQDAMMTRFRALSVDDSLAVAVGELLAGAQHDFPVVADGRVVGLLTRNDLVRGLAAGGTDAKVSSVMRPDCPVVPEHERLEKSYELLRSDGTSALPVVREGRLVGMITLENISEWVMVNSALHHAWTTPLPAARY